MRKQPNRKKKKANKVHPRRKPKEGPRPVIRESRKTETTKPDLQVVPNIDDAPAPNIEGDDWHMHLLNEEE